jgi:peptidoglycan-associated lipoprotein
MLMLAGGCARAKPAAAPANSANVAADGTQRATSAGNGTSTAASTSRVEPPMMTTSLAVSSEIARVCGLRAQSAAGLAFDFDSAQIADEDRAVLAEVARCLVDGALRGRNVLLVGRADPRGEQEYNMALGGSRSYVVQRYLHDLGVQDDRLRSTSRGELDATGEDEASWARDRRVDIQLLN